MSDRQLFTRSVLLAYGVSLQQGARPGDYAIPRGISGKIGPYGWMRTGVPDFTQPRIYIPKETGATPARLQPVDKSSVKCTTAP